MTGYKFPCSPPSLCGMVIKVTTTNGVFVSPGIFVLHNSVMK